MRLESKLFFGFVLWPRTQVGLLSQDLKESVQKLDSAQLDAFATALFDLATLEDLRLWLTQTATSSHLN